MTRFTYEQTKEPKLTISAHNFYKNTLLTKSLLNYKLLKPGHKSPDCSQKSKPKSKWWINKAQQHLQPASQPTTTPSENSSTDTPAPVTTTDATTSNEQPSTWMGVHLAHVQLLERYSSANMQEWILLDSQSSRSIFATQNWSKTSTQSK